MKVIEALENALKALESTDEYKRSDVRDDLELAIDRLRFTARDAVQREL